MLTYCKRTTGYPPVVAVKQASDQVIGFPFFFSSFSGSSILSKSSGLASCFFGFFFSRGLHQAGRERNAPQASAASLVWRALACAGRAASLRTFHVRINPGVPSVHLEKPAQERGKPVARLGAALPAHRVPPRQAGRTTACWLV